MRRAATLLLLVAAPLLLAAGKAPPKLNAFIGKYPFDKVGGVTFFTHPAVKAGMAKAVPNAALRKQMLTMSGPSGPITADKTTIRADACEAHNCGNHTVVFYVRRTDGQLSVCYFNADANNGETVWYLPGATRRDTQPCP